MCSSVARDPAAITDMASSTMTGTFDITRTTGTSSARCFCTNDVRMPAAKLTTRSSDVTSARICDRSTSMSCGFAIRTSTFAQRAASELSSVAVTPYFPASS